MLLEMDQGQYNLETVPLKREDRSSSICVFQKPTVKTILTLVL